MGEGYRINGPSASGSTYSGHWYGSISTGAFEFKDYILVQPINFNTRQKYVNEKVIGTDYFYIKAVVNGTTYNYKISHLNYQSAPVGLHGFQIESLKIPFDSNGKATLSIEVTVTGAKGTIFQGYTLYVGLNHTFSNSATPVSIEMSPSAKKMGDTAIFVVNGGSGTVQHTVSYEFGGLSGEIWSGYRTDYYSKPDEHEWVIPDLLDGCPNATSGMLRVICNSYRFDELIGTSVIEREIAVFPASTIECNTMRIGYSNDITINRNSSKYSTTLRYKLLQSEDVISSDIAEDLYTWDIPYAIGKIMPYTTEETIYIYCDTYHGTALVGTTVEQKKIRIVTAYPSQYSPVIDSLKTNVYIPGAPEEFQGLMLQNVALVDYSVEAHSESSEIDRYTFIGFGKEITIQADKFEGFLAVPAASFAGKHSFNISVTDKRGMTATKYYSWNVHSYNKPKVIPYSVDDANYSAPMCFRSDREGIASGSGTYVRILAGKMCSDVVDDEVNINACKMEYRIRKTGDPWPEEYTELLSYEDSTFASKIIADAFPSTKNSYQIELRVTDLVGFSHSYFAKVSSQKVNFSLLCASDGAAFGKKAEFPGVVEIAQDMTLWVRGELRVDAAEWQTLEVNDNGNTWESSYPHGLHSVSGCYYRIEDGNHVMVSFNRAIKWSGSQIILNSAPIPEAERPKAPVSMICAAENGFVIATVGTDGYIAIDLAWSSKSATQYNWIDGFVHYWKEDT